jgi:protein ImuB
MLWAALHLPLLPLEALCRADPDTSPLAIAQGETRPNIVAINASAHHAGIRPGMGVSAALAIAPRLRVLARNQQAEQQALVEIAQWALQFSPALSIAAPRHVLIEIGGGAKLFNGPAALVGRIDAALPQLGFTALIAAAPTPTAALMFTRARQTCILTDTRTLRGKLAQLPLMALDCGDDTLEILADLGINTLGELLALPRDGLRRRFGTSLTETLDRALGDRPDPRTPYEPPTEFDTRLELPAPAREAEALIFAAKRLIAGLHGWLRGRGLGVMRLTLTLIHEDHAPTAIALNLSAPSRDTTHLVTLLRERLYRTRLPDRVETIVLATRETAALAARDLALFPGTEAADETELIERLSARLGNDAVAVLRPYADHRPEHAWRDDGPSRPTTPVPVLAPRPLWLLPQPQPLARFLTYTHTPITLMDGPERIENGWWEERDVRRDYFIARTKDGRLLWIFRPIGLGEDWHVHGLFA